MTVDPLTGIGFILGIGGVVVLLFWPDRGVLARWLQFRLHAQRVLIEDVLKHAYDCEYKKVSCTLQSIAGVLRLPADRTADIVRRVELMGLMTSRSSTLELTSEGRSYALRMIRVHRLWERYLADETSMTALEWHPAAERKEHKMSPDETEALSQQMGHPRFDPHGDPIPTSAGEIPQLSGVLLTTLSAGQTATVVHIEDEPQAVYAQLVAQGIYPGMHVRLMEVSNERIRFVADGEDCVLAPIIAANITVHPLAEGAKTQTSFKTLASLNPGEEAEVVGISRACRGQQRRRLMDLGIVPGTRVKAELRGAGGDPTAYDVRGTTLALRKQQTDFIYIQPTGMVAS